MQAKPSLRSVAERNALVTQNMVLVKWFVGRYRAISRSVTLQRMDMDDALQVGYMGLIRAAETYVPGKGAFSTWACWWIRNSIQQSLTRESVVKVPKRFFDGHRKDNDEAAPYVHNSISPTHDEADEGFGQLVDFDHLTFTEADPTDADGFRHEECESLLSLLSPDEAELLRLRYFEGMDTPQIGAIYGVHQTSIRKRIVNVVAKLRRLASLNNRENVLCQGH